MFDIFVIYCSSLSPSLFCVCKLGQFSISCHGAGQYLTLAILPLSCSVRYHPESAAANIIWYHPKSSDISQYHLISANTIRYQPISSDTIRYHLISSDISQYHLISANISQYHPIQSGMSCANIIANFLSSFGFTLSLWDCSSIVFTLPPYCTFITSWHFLQQIRILSNCHHHQNIWGHLTLRCTSDFLFSPTCSGNLIEIHVALHLDFDFNLLHKDKFTWKESSQE